MIKSELTRTFKSTKGKIGIILIFLLPFIDFLQHIYGDIIVFGDIESYHLNHPAYSSFLAGSSIGHFTQILLFWILPLYFLLLYSDSYTTDRNYGYLNCLFSRTGRKNYYKDKFKIAFFVPIILTFSSLILNLLLNIIVFHKGTLFGGMENYYDDMDNWFIFGYHHPYIYYLVYTLIVSLICGLSSILGLNCSILFRNHFRAYPATFFIWFLQVILPFGIGNTIQPFTEYGIKYYFLGFIIFVLSILIVFLITYFTRLKKDDT